MKLHYRILGEGKPLFVMHGVFGSSDNWQSVGKILADNYKVYFVDLRNHGNSPHSYEFDYDNMAADILELMDDEQIDSAYLLGHSMGGKVAMNFSMYYPKRVEKMIVVDIAPKDYPPHHQQIFDGFRSVNLREIQSRGEADRQMSSVIPNMGVRQFILKNLQRDKNGEFSWKLNLKVIEKAASRVGDGLPEGSHFDQPTLFIAGSKSDYILPSDHKHIKEVFPQSTIQTVEGAGHWVHAEKPQELISMVIDFL